MFPTKDWIEQKKRREQEAKDKGYSPEEIKKAYEISRIRRVSYIDGYSLEEARLQLNNK
jgi:hypothetical protein